MSDLDRLAEHARSRGLTIAVAESLTSGLLAARIGEGEDAAEWFAGGVVAYQVAVKESVLGVEPGLDPCSPVVAAQLAEGVRELLDADLAVSTTGVGGPEAANGHPPGTVFVGWATRDATGSEQLVLTGEPSEVLATTVERAIETVARIAERL